MITLQLYYSKTEQNKSGDKDGRRPAACTHQNGVNNFEQHILNTVWKPEDFYKKHKYCQPVSIFGIDYIIILCESLITQVDQPGVSTINGCRPTGS